MRLRDWLAGTIFTVGFLWQFGLRILDWIGRVLAARDAHEWLDGIRQPIEGWFASHPDLSSRIGPWVLMASGLGAILITHIVPWLHSHVRRKDIQLVFPNECNSEFKYVPRFKESSAPLFSGMPAPNKSMHE